MRFIPSFFAFKPIRLSNEQAWMLDLSVLTLLLALMFALFLGNHPLGVPDEARYAEIPREMVVNSDYITPHINAVKYFEKPVLFYWMQAGAIKLGGLSEWSVRAPNAIMALLGCLLIYAAGRMLYDRRTGWLASIISATSLLYFAMAHIITLDMTFSVLLSGSLFVFLLGIRFEPGTKRRNYLYGAYALSALAVLTKGLVGILFPMMIVGVWMLLLNDWRLLKTMYLPTGLIIFFLIAAPWHILVQLKNPEFLRFYFIDQQFSRYLTHSAGRYKPAWFFIPVAIAGFFPWTAFLGQAVAKHWPRPWSTRKQHKKELFLLLWPLLILIFFSLSDSKLVPYILPVIPPVAILIAHYFSANWKKADKTLGIIRGYASLTPLVLLIGTAVFIFAEHPNAPFNANNSLNYVGYMTVVWTIGAGIAAWLSKKNYPTLTFSILVVSTTFAYWILLSSLTVIDLGSIKPLALELKTMLKPSDEVVSYETYYQDLPYYLQQRVMVVDWRGELAFGMQHQDTSAWMIDSKTFWNEWQAKPRIYMFTNHKTYENLLLQSPYQVYLVDQTIKDVLLVNHR